MLVVILTGLTWLWADAQTAQAQATPWAAGHALSAAVGQGATARRRKKPKPQPADGDGESAKPGKGAAGPAPGAAAGDTSMAGMRRSNRMEFDARLVKGERPKAGAVYLFQRAPRRLPPLVKLRQSYLGEIVDPILGAPDHRDAPAHDKKSRKTPPAPKRSSSR
jgi:hypothetical protein